jgi:integrase
MRSRPRGLGSIYRRGPLFWVRYSVNGIERRESARSTSRSDALTLLKRRLQESREGPVLPPVTFSTLAEDYLQRRRLDGISTRSLWWSENRVEVLRAHFGRMHAEQITSSEVEHYARRAREHGDSAGTVNRTLGVLRRMLRLAQQAGKLQTVPEARLRGARHVRGDLRPLMPAHADIARFLYLSAWRRGEALALEWRDVSLADGTIRLRPEVCKTRQPRLFVLTGALREMIECRHRERRQGESLVFHEAARHVTTFVRAWHRACTAAGVPGTLIHDLRRSGVRNGVKAGIPERVVMQMSGHKTRAVFDRYHIVSEADLRQASDKLAAYIAASA